MNEGIHLDLNTWIVPGQIRKANLCIACVQTNLLVYYSLSVFNFYLTRLFRKFYLFLCWL